MRSKRKFGQGGSEGGWRKFTPIQPTDKVATEKIPGVSSGNPCIKLRGNPCASKLVFLKADDAKKRKTIPGANLQFCVGERKLGPTIPVASDAARRVPAANREAFARGYARGVQAWAASLQKRAWCKALRRDEGFGGARPGGGGGRIRRELRGPRR